MNTIIRKQKDHQTWILFSPKGCFEWIVFVLSILYFSLIATLFLQQRAGNAIPEMLGYDTSVHMLVEHKMINFQHIFSWNIRHPLLNFFFLPPLLIDYFLSLFNFNFKWEVFTLYSALIASYTGLLLFKIISIICKKSTAIVLLILFYSFAHTILLSIQIDSFIYSMLFLTMLILIYITNKQSTLINNVLFLALTGTTSTNMIKFIIYLYLSSKRKIKDSLFIFFKSIPLFLCLFAITIPDFFYKLFIQHLGLKYSLLAQTMDYRGSSLSKLHLFIDNFISEPFLFHYHYNLLYTSETINLPPYSDIYCCPVIIVIICISVTSIIINFKHEIVQLFLGFFSIDIIIHFIIGYGIEEGQLFCGHWFFFIPLLMGLLAKQTTKQNILSIYNCTIGGIATYLMYYNFNCYLHSTIIV